MKQGIKKPPNEPEVFLYLGFFAVSVVLIFTFHAEQYQQSNRAYDGNENAKIPPTGTTQIMKTANAQTDAGNQNGQREYQAENLPAEQYAVNDAQNQADDEYKQNKIPVLRTVGTAVEVGIVIFQHVYEVGVEQGFDFFDVHSELLMF